MGDDQQDRDRSGSADDRNWSGAVADLGWIWEDPAMGRSRLTTAGWGAGGGFICALLGVCALAPAASAHYAVYATARGNAIVTEYGIGPGGALQPTSASGPYVNSGNGPFAIAVSPEGSHAYVTNFTDGTVSEYTIGSNGSLSPSTGAPTVQAGTHPGGIAISPDGKHVFVTNNGDSTVSEFAVQTGGSLSPSTGASTVQTGGAPNDIAVSPDGKHAYVANFVGTVSEYSIGVNGLLSPSTGASTIASGTDPQAIVLTPDGQHAYVPNYYDATVSQYSIAADGTLSALSPATVASGLNPNAIAITPNGKHAYVTNLNGNTVSEYSIGSNGALSPSTGAPTVATNSQPNGIAVTPDGKYLYVTNFSSPQLSEYSIGAGGSLTALSSTPAAGGSEPEGIVVAPAGPTASFTDVPAQAGRASTFSAGWFDPSTTIAAYRWSFGDGTNGSGQVTSHTYAHAGTYTVTLTETDVAGCGSTQPFPGEAGPFTGHTSYCELHPASKVSRSITVPPPTATLSITHVHAVTKAVSFRAACHGAPCAATATLTTKQGQTQVTVGMLSFNLVAGATKNFTVELNAKGQMLVKRADLHVTLTVTLRKPNGRHVVVTTAHVTILRHS